MDDLALEQLTMLTSPWDAMCEDELHKLPKTIVKAEILKKSAKSDLASSLLAKAAEVHSWRASDSGIVSELSVVLVPEAITEIELATDFWRMPQAGRVVAIVTT